MICKNSLQPKAKIKLSVSTQVLTQQTLDLRSLFAQVLQPCDAAGPHCCQYVDNRDGAKTISCVVYSKRTQDPLRQARTDRKVLRHGETMSRRNQNSRLEPLPKPAELTPEEQAAAIAFLRGIDSRMSAGNEVSLDASEAKRIVRRTAKRLHKQHRKLR
jgi:hypothetical protein